MTIRSLCLRGALAASVAVVAVAVPQIAFSLGDKVEAGSCAIANSGSASGNTVTCNFNMPPEKLKELIEAAVKGGEDPILDRLVLVSKTLGRERIGAGESVYRISGAPAGSGDRVAVQTEASDGRRDPKPRTKRAA